MNDRLRKKNERRRRRMVHEMLDLVLDINGLGERQRETTGTLPTAFFRFFGNASSVEVGIHKNGWFPDSNEDIRIGARTDRDVSWCDRLDSAVRKLRAIKAETLAGGAAREPR